MFEFSNGVSEWAKILFDIPSLFSLSLSVLTGEKSLSLGFYFKLISSCESRETSHKGFQIYPRRRRFVRLSPVQFIHEELSR